MHCRAVRPLPEKNNNNKISKEMLPQRSLLLSRFGSISRLISTLDFVMYSAACWLRVVFRPSKASFTGSLARFRVSLGIFDKNANYCSFRGIRQSGGKDRASSISLEPYVFARFFISMAARTRTKRSKEVPLITAPSLSGTTLCTNSANWLRCWDK